MLVEVVVPVNIQDPKTIVFGSLRPYQKDRFIRIIKTIAKYIATPPFFMVPKRYRRNADCLSVPHTSDLLVNKKETPMTRSMITHHADGITRII